MATFEFVGVETKVELEPFLADERMQGFQDELVRYGSTSEEARSLSEELLSVLIEKWGNDFAESLANNFEEMTRIRQELRSKYDLIRDTFAPDRPPVTELPAELRPESFNERFNRLEELMDDIPSPEDFLDRKATGTDIMEAVESAGEGEGETGAGEPAESDFRKPRIDDAPRRTASRVARAKGVAEGLVTRAFPNPGEWKVSVTKPTLQGRAAVGQYERLRNIDPVFAGQALEPRFKGPGGIDFQPDGIEMPSDGSFTFLDNKESFVDATQESGYFAGEANRELRSRLQRDAYMAATLRRGGARCNGWKYFTGNADLANLMRAIAEEIRTNVGGEELFDLIEIVGPGQ